MSSSLLPLPTPISHGLVHPAEPAAHYPKQELPPGPKCLAVDDVEDVPNTLVCHGRLGVWETGP